MSELTNHWPLFLRRVVWWTVVEIVAGLATGAVLGVVLVIILVILEGSGLALIILGIAVGAALGGIAGVIAGLLGTVGATVMSRREALNERTSAALGAAATFVGSVAVVGYISRGEDDVSWFLFALAAVAVATWVGWRLGPRVEGRVGPAA